MGATPDDKFANLLERPRHLVTIGYAFEIGERPVTFAEWDAFAHAVSGAHRPADPFGRGEMPVVNVSHEDAVAYCDWVSSVIQWPFRLPTEAEWEYACRAGSETVFHTGDAIALDQANYLYSEIGEKIGRGRPTVVGSYPPNAWGVYDLHGNVAEHVADAWHDGYDGAPTDGSAWVDASDKNVLFVLRGGAWDHLPRLLRSAHRDWVDRARWLDNVGFRVACDG
jgi:formylglycine-generating enzyme required for sulfatase activity